MTVPLKPLITDAGLAAAIAKNGSGLQLEMTHVQLGTTGYTLDYTEGSPDYARTALVAPKEKSGIAGGYVLPGNIFRADVLMPEWGGTPSPYDVHEIGFFAGDPNAGGVLFALFSHATQVIATRVSSLQYLATFKGQLVRVPAGSVTVTVDPNLSHAAALLAAHEAAPNPHPQYFFPRHRQLFLSQLG